MLDSCGAYVRQTLPLDIFRRRRYFSPRGGRGITFSFLGQPNEQENPNMARRTVSQLAYVEIATPRLQESRDFYVDVLGMTEVAQNDDGIFLRAWGDYLPYSLQLTDGDDAALRRIGWRADSAEDLERVAGELPGEWTDDNVGRGRAFAFKSPSGHVNEIFWDTKPLDVPAELRSTFPNRPQKFAPRGVGVRQIDHVTVGSENPLSEAEWFRDKLDFRFMEYTLLDASSAEPFFTMVSTTEQAHNLGLALNSTGVVAAAHHVAFWLDQEVDVLRAAAILQEAGVPLEYGPGRHGMGENTYLYVREPSGFRIEIFSGGYRNYLPDWQPVRWTPEEGSNDMYRNRVAPGSMMELFPAGRASAEAEGVSVNPFEAASVR
jgi:catechol 2,3-dioxygenase